MQAGEDSDEALGANAGPTFSKKLPICHLLGAMFATRGSWHRYERSKDAIRGSWSQINEER